MEYSAEEVQTMRQEVLESGIDDAALQDAANANDVDGVITRLETMLNASYNVACAKDAVMSESAFDGGEGLYMRIALYRLLRQFETSVRRRWQDDDSFLSRVGDGGQLVPRLGGIL